MRASLAPIIVALLSLISISLLGFAVAWWPQDLVATSAPSAADRR